MLNRRLLLAVLVMGLLAAGLVWFTGRQSGYCLPVQQTRYIDIVRRGLEEHPYRLNDPVVVQRIVEEIRRVQVTGRTVYWLAPDYILCFATPAGQVEVGYVPEQYLVINNRLYAVSRALANVLKPEIDLAETYFWKFGVPYPWTDQERVFPLDTVAVVIDFESGKRFRAQFLDGDNHADCQTLTAADTAIYKEIYGGVWSWERRAVILQAHGYRLAASMIGQPHGAGSIPDNELPGHFCIHFLGSRTHAGAALDQKHQEMVLKAAGKKVFREDKYPEEANN